MSSKLLYVIVGFAFIGSTAWAEEPSAEAPSAPSRETFQSTYWGMVENDVRRIYPDIKGATEHGFKAQALVASRPALTSFSFTNNRLYRVNVLFTVGFFKEGFMSTSCELTDFDGLRELLTKRFGPVKTEDVQWERDTQLPNRSRWGRFIDTGYLSVFSVWETGETVVTLGCSQDGLTVQYESKALRELANSRTDSKQMTEL